MLPIRVTGLTRAPGATTAVVVVETATGDRALGFHVPLNEASRLARQLGLTACRCTPIWDLVATLLPALRARIAHAVLDATAEGIVARLAIENEGEALSLECHPGDALGLALRSAAPIFATAEALSHGVARPVAGDIATWLDRVRPADFAPTDDTA